MRSSDTFTKSVLYLAIILVLACFLSGCKAITSIGDTTNGLSQDEIDEIEADAHGKKLKKKPEKSPNSQVRSKASSADAPQQVGLVKSIKNIFIGQPQNTQMVNGRPVNVKKAVAPIVELPAPELENVNRYAKALEEKLQRRYNNTPEYAGNIAKVQLLPMGKPDVSLDGKKLRMRWSQVVFDTWGKRVSDLEQEYYVVTFGDGNPLMQRTRPTITVGLNNEGGYSEFTQVRGGRFSGLELKSGPDMFDRPDSEKTGLLDDNLKAKDSAAAPYMEYELPGEPGNKPAQPVASNTPVIPPAEQPVQAVVVLEEM